MLLKRLILILTPFLFELCQICFACGIHDRRGLLLGSTEKIVTAATKLHCIKQCVIEKSFRCLSVNYSPEEDFDNCSLNSGDISTHPDFFNQQTTFIYAERPCVVKRWLYPS